MVQTAASGTATAIPRRVGGINDEVTGLHRNPVRTAIASAILSAPVTATPRLNIVLVLISILAKDVETCISEQQSEEKEEEVLLLLYIHIEEKQNGINDRLGVAFISLSSLPSSSSMLLFDLIIL